MTHLLEQSTKLLGPWLPFPSWLTMHIDIYIFIPINIIYIFPSYSHSPFATYQAIISPSSTISSDPQRTSIILLSSSRHTCPSIYTMSATFCCLGLNSIWVLMSLLWLYLANSFLAFLYSNLIASTSYGMMGGINVNGGIILRYTLAYLFLKVLSNNYSSHLFPHHIFSTCALIPYDKGHKQQYCVCKPIEDAHVTSCSCWGYGLVHPYLDHAGHPHVQCHGNNCVDLLMAMCL